ncbi:Protein SEY1 [Trichinella spiralis]|uniref:Protein SEY1 n=1 Tax=Trichinella spiralis TaxID=6334 RepID=A0ABR3KCX7_TRISP
MGSPCDYLSASLASFQRPICQKKFKNIPPEHDKRVNSRCLRTRHAPSSGSSSEVTSMLNIGSENEKMQHYRRRAAKKPQWCFKCNNVNKQTQNCCTKLQKFESFIKNRFSNETITIEPIDIRRG